VRKPCRAERRVRVPSALTRGMHNILTASGSDLDPGTTPSAHMGSPRRTATLTFAVRMCPGTTDHAVHA
jgi:hypothetical protein